MAISDKESFPAITPPIQMRGGMVSITRPRSPYAHQAATTMATPALAPVNIYALPPDHRAWSLIEQYFQKTGQLLPFIHETSFCETYVQMRRERFTKVSRTWLGLLNIVFAISASLSSKDDISPAERIQESDIYYQRANGLCDRVSKRSASLEIGKYGLTLGLIVKFEFVLSCTDLVKLVQYLLILGQYLQGTQKSVQAWTTHGLAISAAYQLGLHSPDANKAFSLLECEIRKRTWFGCVLLDR